MIVISTGSAVDAKAEARTAVERRAAQERNRHRCAPSGRRLGCALPEQLS